MTHHYFSNVAAISVTATSPVAIAMARQRVAFDHAMLVDLAEQATTSTNLQGVDLVCTYVQEEAKLSRRSNVTFQWHAKTQDHQASEQVRVRVDHAYNQGIPLPTSWRTASRCLSLDETANRSADAERCVAYPDLMCEILGMAKTVAVPSSEHVGVPSVLSRAHTTLAVHVQG